MRLSLKGLLKKKPKKILNLIHEKVLKLKVDVNFFAEDQSLNLHVSNITPAENVVEQIKMRSTFS